jgi:GT2 family glycosyltransferase
MRMPLRQRSEAEISVTVCICTRDRPAELERALASITRSTYPVAQVVVADDSSTDASRTLLHDAYPEATYVEGPQRGLGANRNAAIDHARGMYVLFLDDDAVLGETYLERALKCAEAPRGTIVTGVEQRNGTRVFPNDQTFLGHQRRPYRRINGLNTIVINGTLFPRELFEQVRFDEQLVYGFEEVDLASRAAALGFDIVLCADAVNYHFPSPANRKSYEPFTQASRLYVTFKRYAFTERRPAKALAYALIAPLHALAAGTKAGGLRGAADGARAVHRAIGYVTAHARNRRRHGSHRS